jgi:hypothetical protein
MMQIERLEEAIYAVQFEQHWLQSQTDRQEVGVFTNPSFVFLSSKLLVHGSYIGYCLSEYRISQSNSLSNIVLLSWCVCCVCGGFESSKPSSHILHYMIVGIFTVNRAMSRRVLYKAALEAFALVGSSVLQVVLLRRLFERKLGQSRV